MKKVDPEQKRGFMMNIYSTHFPVPGLAEFASTAANVAGPIDTLFDQYVAGASANPGKLPACIGSTCSRGEGWKITTIARSLRSTVIRSPRRLPGRVFRNPDEKSVGLPGR